QGRPTLHPASGTDPSAHPTFQAGARVSRARGVLSAVVAVVHRGLRGTVRRPARAQGPGRVRQKTVAGATAGAGHPPPRQRLVSRPPSVHFFPGAASGGPWGGGSRGVGLPSPGTWAARQRGIGGLGWQAA